VRTFRLATRIALAATVILCCRADAAAQTPSPVARADVGGTLSWLAVEKDFGEPYGGNDWHSSLFAGAAAGWYWTDHLKTEVDFGAGTDARTAYFRPLSSEDRVHGALVESRFAQRTLGVSQQYQFFRNAWFHPHVAAGAHITWATTVDEFQPVPIYDGSLPPRTIEPARREERKTDVAVRPFLATGFKAYMTGRGFIRGDVRVAFRSGIDELQLRVGFGVDFQAAGRMKNEE
jgi:hypothetical protein